jgi:hypothetical protein
MMDSMHVELRNQRDEVVGEVRLTERGTLDWTGAAKGFQDESVLGPNGVVEPTDPVAYLQTVPWHFRSPYFHGVLMP